MFSDVFVNLGGFKNLYPLVESVIESNLIKLDKLKPGKILSWVFVLLNSLMHAEPTHINKIFKTRNLLMILKFILLRIGMK